VIAHHAGRSFHPREIERVLSEHPGVADVAVVGVDHPSGAGEIVVAYVSCWGDLLVGETLQQYCAEQGLCSSRIPELWLISTKPLPKHGGKGVAKRSLQSLEKLQEACRDIAEAAVARVGSCGEDLGCPLDLAIPKDAVVDAVFFAADTDGDRRLDASEWAMFCNYASLDDASAVLRQACSYVRADVSSRESSAMDHATWRMLVECIGKENRGTFLLLCQSIAASLNRCGVLQRLAWPGIVGTSPCE